MCEKVLHLPENHITVGELLEQKSSTEVENVNTPHVANGDTSWNPDSEYSQATGGFSVAFSLSVVQVAITSMLSSVMIFCLLIHRPHLFILKFNVTPCIPFLLL
jgi:exocyst complex component 4